VAASAAAAYQSAELRQATARRASAVPCHELVQGIGDGREAVHARPALACGLRSHPSGDPGDLR